jgi:hypothetical protein
MTQCPWAHDDAVNPFLMWFCLLDENHEGGHREGIAVGDASDTKPFPDVEVYTC